MEKVKCCLTRNVGRRKETEKEEKRLGQSSAAIKDTTGNYKVLDLAFQTGHCNNFQSNFTFPNGHRLYFFKDKKKAGD